MKRRHKTRRKRRLNPNRKVKVTVALTPSVIEQVRNFVYWTPPLTVASFVESVILTKLEKLPKRKRFRVRKGRMRVGRPRKHPKK
jgi:hypothetical protein